MFREAFEKLELAEIATILDQINPLFEGTIFDPVETAILAIDLSFYPGFRFLDISNSSVMPTVQRFVIFSLEKSIVINFTNEPIYRLNKELPIQLNIENIFDYVRFFFSYVRGRHGRFVIAESPDDIQWKEEPPPAARKAIAKMLKPLSIKQEGKGSDVYNMEVCMMFKDSLFKSDVNVSAEGFVTLDNEELLIEDMPILDDTFGQ